MTLSRLYNMARGSKAALLIASTALVVMPSCTGAGPSRPNVLLVVISGLRADHVSSYGYRRGTTPSTDALAASGALFESAISTSSSHLASQGSIMTGLFPSEHAAVFDRPQLDSALETLAEKLKARGYATFAVSTSPDISAASGFDQGFDTFIEVLPHEQGLPDDGAAVVEAELLKWLGAQAGGDKPLFLYALLTNPGLPYSPPGDYAREFIERPVPQSRVDGLMQLWVPFARRYSLGSASLAGDDLETLISLYDVRAPSRGSAAPSSDRTGPGSWSRQPAPVYRPPLPPSRSQR